jgi:hypothetical protein
MKLLSMLVLMGVLLTLYKAQTQPTIREIRYEAFSRGGDYQVQISKDSIRVRSGLGATSFTSKALEPGRWEQVVALLEGVSLEDLDHLEAPTANRYTDAAAQATVRVVTDSKVYVSSAFDDGNPPLVLQPLVKAMITLAETIE